MSNILQINTMSLENTDSHNDNMAPVNDKTADEEVQCKYSSIAFNDPDW